MDRPTTTRHPGREVYRRLRLKLSRHFQTRILVAMRSRIGLALQPIHDKSGVDTSNAIRAEIFGAWADIGKRLQKNFGRFDKLALVFIAIPSHYQNAKETAARRDSVSILGKRGPCAAPRLRPPRANAMRMIHRE